MLLKHLIVILFSVLLVVAEAGNLLPLAAAQDPKGSTAAEARSSRNKRDQQGALKSPPERRARKKPRRAKPIRTAAPVPTTTPVPYPTNVPLSSDDECALYVINERLQRCCGQWERQPDKSYRYNAFQNCSWFAEDFRTWCAKSHNFECMTIHVFCRTEDGELEPMGHAANVVNLGASWAVVDQTAGAVVATIPEILHPLMPVAGPIACQVMGRSPEECGCNQDGQCRCWAIRALDTFPNTDPGYCAHRSKEAQGSVALAECKNCCQEIYQGDYDFGPEFCAATFPRIGSYIAEWLAMCVAWFEDIEKRRNLCEHACRTEIPEPCTPNCETKECGYDGCGGSCGECATNAVCRERKSPQGVVVAKCSPEEPGADIGGVDRGS